jgi:hypothetical protein
MAYYGRLAEEATPSRELIKESLDDAAYTFTAVSARDVSTILDTVLEGSRSHARPATWSDGKRLCPTERGGRVE